MLQDGNLLIFHQNRNTFDQNDNNFIVQTVMDPTAAQMNICLKAMSAMRISKGKIPFINNFDGFVFQ